MAEKASESAGGLIDVLAAGSGIDCLVGAGGKKSTIYRIVSQATGRVAGHGAYAAVSVWRRKRAPAVELRSRVAGASASRIVAYACPSDKKARLAGVDPDLVMDIHQSCGFDITLVKADGARLRRLKAPGSHEPAVPARFATLIVLVSVHAVGEPLDEIVAHRPEVVAALTGAEPGRRITADHVARLLTHPQGGLKHAGRADRVVPVINMVDTHAQKYTARLIADQVLQRAPGLDRVVLARMVSEDPVVEVLRR